LKITIPIGRPHPIGCHPLVIDTGAARRRRVVKTNVAPTTTITPRKRRIIRRLCRLCGSNRNRRSFCHPCPTCHGKSGESSTSRRHGRSMWMKTMTMTMKTTRGTSGPGRAGTAHLGARQTGSQKASHRIDDDQSHMTRGRVEFVLGRASGFIPHLKTYTDTLSPLAYAHKMLPLPVPRVLCLSVPL